MKLCLMASQSYSTLGFTLLPEQGSNEIIKRNRACLLNHGRRKQEILPKIYFDMKPLPPLKRVLLLTSSRPEKARIKPSPKNHNPKIRDKENDLYKRNHLHACEILISLMIEQHRQATMQSLKKSRRELSELLTRSSIGIAGIGIAVLFSVVLNVACRRIPFSANMFFDGTVSSSLILLSWAVSRLKEAIVDGTKKAIKEEEMTHTVEKRISEVLVRAATVIIMVALRLH